MKDITKDDLENRLIRVAKQSGGHKTQIEAGSCTIGGTKVCVIAGPCAVESREQIFNITKLD